VNAELFVFRHATAVPRSADLDDDARALTPRGRKRFARCVEALERLEIDLDRIYHSPALRAVETAELLVPLLEGETVVTPLLAQPPSGELLHALEGERIAVVGHEPWLSDLVSWLVFGVRIADPDGRSESPGLRKGALAWLSGPIEPGSMVLRAFLPPKTLRRLART